MLQLLLNFTDLLRFLPHASYLGSILCILRQNPFNLLLVIILPEIDLLVEGALVFLTLFLLPLDLLKYLSI